MKCLKMSQYGDMATI